MKNRILAVGSNVCWNWRGRVVKGRVKKIIPRRIEMQIRGARYVRNGSPESPAYLVVSEAGSDVLKAATELKSAPRKR